MFKIDFKKNEIKEEEEDQVSNKRTVKVVET